MVPGPGRGVHSRLAPGGVLLALGNVALGDVAFGGGVGIDVRVELVGAALQRVGLLTLLLGIGAALLRRQMLLLGVGGLLLGGRALPLCGERLVLRLAAVLVCLDPLLLDPAGLGLAGGALCSL